MSRIEQKLVSIGASHVSREYKDERVVAFMYRIGDLFYKLPARVEAILNVMVSDLPPRSKKSRDDLYPQAERTAWKILSDWIDLQASMILLDQVKVEEIMLPFMYSMKHGKTFFEIAGAIPYWNQKNFRALRIQRYSVDLSRSSKHEVSSASSTLIIIHLLLDFNVSSQ